jgi:hypothetical protein
MDSTSEPTTIVPSTIGADQKQSGPQPGDSELLQGQQVQQGKSAGGEVQHGLRLCPEIATNGGSSAEQPSSLLGSMLVGDATDASTIVREARKTLRQWEAEATKERADMAGMAKTLSNDRKNNNSNSGKVVKRVSWMYRANEYTQAFVDDVMDISIHWRFWMWMMQWCAIFWIQVTLAQLSAVPAEDPTIFQTLVTAILFVPLTATICFLRLFFFAIAFVQLVLTIAIVQEAHSLLKMMSNTAVVQEAHSLLKMISNTAHNISHYFRRV